MKNSSNHVLAGDVAFSYEGSFHWAIHPLPCVAKSSQGLNRSALPQKATIHLKTEDNLAGINVYAYWVVDTQQASVELRNE